MRPLLPGDISSAARALLMVPRSRRQAVCIQMLEHAETADLHVRETGRVHLDYGNGSLMAAARRVKLPDEPLFGDPDYCDCTALVLREVARFLRQRVKKKRGF